MFENLATAPAKVVVIGGGTGSPASIRASLSCGFRTISVVAMADDGGSSGLLRSHTGKLPPGDVRKCLVAMASSQNDPWVRAFRQRYPYLNNHTLGNLMLTALEDATDSLPQAISLCEQLLKTRGHVLPSTLDTVQMSGVTRDGTNIDGQSSLCASSTALAQVSLLGNDPQPYPPVLDAIAQAELIVIGPGSLFTSLIAALLVPGIIKAIKASAATVAYVTPITDHQGETWGLCASELVETLQAHGLGSRLQIVIANSLPVATVKNEGAVTAVFNALSEQDLLAQPSSESNTAAAGPCQSAQPASASEISTIRYLSLNEADAQRIACLGPRLIRRQLTDPAKPDRHNVKALGAVFREVIEECRLRQR